MPKKHADGLRWATVGVQVQVKYRKNIFYAAEVIEIDTEGGATSVKVSYPGWPKTHDEWVTDASKVKKLIDPAELLLKTAKKVHSMVA